MKASIASVEKLESKISTKHELLARALKLQGMAESTTKCYLRGFRRVCEYFNRLPDYLLVSEFELVLCRPHRHSLLEYSQN